MQIDSRLSEIDDCLYRVSIRVLIVQNNKVLMVKEKDNDWWALPGGGVDYGETVKSTLEREVGEELGVPANEISTDFQIAYFNIGNVINSVPRMNLFFKVSVPEHLLKKTTDVTDWAWFTRDQFLEKSIHPAHDNIELQKIIFKNN